MPGLSENIKSILAGAPELVNNPGLTVGLAQGAVAPQSGPVDPVAVGQSASLTANAAGAQQAQSAALDMSPEAQAFYKQALGDVASVSHSSGLLGEIKHVAVDDTHLGTVASSATQTFDDVKSGSATALSGITKALNLPLQQVQHYYRTVHDIWTRYGVLDAVETMAAPPGLGEGVHPGKFASSWKLTSNGTQYRDVHGNAVNPGFDLANIVDNVVNGHDYMPQGWTRDENGQMQPTGTGGIDAPTGVANAIFDLVYDPTLKAGKVTEGIKAGNGLIIGGKTVDLADDAATRTKQLQDLADGGNGFNITPNGKTAYVGGRTLVGGRVPATLIDTDGNAANNIPWLAATSPAVTDAFTKLASMNTQDILHSYPMLRTLAGPLGRAQSVDDVTNVFRDAISNRNYGFLQNGLPTTSLTRRVAAKVGVNLPTPAAAGATFADNSGRLGHSLTSYRPFTIDSRSLQISGSEFDPDDPASLTGIHSALLISQSRKNADQILAKYIEAPDLGTRVNVITNAFRDSIRAMASGHGMSDSDIDALPVMQKFGRDIDFLNKNATRPIYGVGEDGRPVFGQDPETGEPLNFGLFSNQTGKLAFPNFNEVRKQIADAGGAKAMLTRGDDWVYTHYTSPIFKNLALLSGGFALRVSAAELIPAIIQNGIKDVLGSGLSAVGAKLNPGLADLADEYGKDSLQGVTAKTPAGDIGHIRSVSGKTATVVTANGAEKHALDTLDALHTPIPDDDIRSAAGQLGIEVAKNEVPHYRAAIGHAMYGVSRGLVDDDYYKQARSNILTFGGHETAPGLMSNHDIMGTGAGPAEDLRNMLEQAGARIPDKPTTLGDTWTMYADHQSEQPMFWNFAANEASKDPGVKLGSQAYLNAIRSGASKDEANKAFVDADSEWIKNGEGDVADKFRTSMALNGQGAEQYAKLRAAAVRGLVYGKDGTLHKDVLAGIAGEQDVPSIADLSRKDFDARPLKVKGRELSPIAPVGGLERMTQWGWKTFLHPTINSMSRAPIYTMLSTKEYKFLKPLVESGYMDDEEARQIARVRGANRMLPLIHNTKLRSQASDITRNIVPFYFAQEQAYKRYGRVMFSNPVAFRRALLGIHGLHNSGAIEQDPNGNKTVVLPGASELSKWATIGAAGIGLPVLQGIPSVISGDMISLKSVAPTGNAPSVSPLVAVPLKEIQRYFPQSEPFVSRVIGGVNESESVTDQLIPSATLKRALQATPILDRESGFNTAYLNAIAYAAHQRSNYLAQASTAADNGNRVLAKSLTAKANAWLPGPNADPFVQQSALDRIKHTTRIMALVKTAVGAVSPLSPVMDVGDIKLRAEVQADIAKYGLATGLQTFLDKNPTATADTVFDSDNSETGTALPATKAALDWTQKNVGWIGSHALAAAYLIPQTPQAFDVEAYNQELAIGLRNKKSPQTMLQSLYAAATDPQYYASLTDYENMRKQYANDPYQLQQLSENWTTYKAGLASANPVWAASQDDAQKVSVARVALHQLQSALADPSTPQSPQTGIASQLSNDYQEYLAQTQEIRSGQSTQTLTDLKDSFNGYLDQVVKKNPAASALVTGIFRRLVNAD